MIGSERPHTSTISGLPSLLKPSTTLLGESSRNLETGTCIYTYISLYEVTLIASRRTRSRSWDPQPPSKRKTISTHQPSPRPVTHKRREDFRHALVKMIM